MSTLQLYFDDLSTNLQYSSTGWVDNSSVLWTDGRAKWVDQFPGAGLTFKFNGDQYSSLNTPESLRIPPAIGTSASFYGASLNDSAFEPTIDDLVQPKSILPVSNPPSYGRWYRTPPLQPGEHTVVFKDLPQLMLDYIIVEVDPDTTFRNAPVLVSDTDSEIKYLGSWQQDYGRFKTLQPFTFIGDYTTHSSCNPGDRFSLDFSGSSISLWGVFDWGSTGSFTAAYFIDGELEAEQLNQAAANSQGSIFGVQTNFPLFSKDGLEERLHTLMVNITACQNQNFALDYITYTPSFTSAKAKPTGSSTPVPLTKSSRLPTGAIAGLAVGAAALVAIVGAIIWFCRRRRKGSDEQTDADPFDASLPTSAVQKKEEVPAQMRGLRSPGSQDTFSGIVDLAAEDSRATNGAWIIATNQNEFRNINELVTTLPPPAYQNRGSEPAAAADGPTEATTTSHNRSRS